MELNFLEIFGTIVGLVYLWLEYRASIYLWIAGIVMPAIYIFVYYKAGLYADFGINIYYLIAAIYGWFFWMWGHRKKKSQQSADASIGDKPKDLPIVHTPWKCYLPLFLVFIVAFIGIAWILIEYTDSNVPWLDSFTTALSIVGMWMLARKYVEQWFAWILVDIVCCGLYIYKDLYFTSALYGLYSIIAIFGYFKWKKNERTMISEHYTPEAVILANGEYPTHTLPLKILEEAKFVICCDGAANEYILRGHTPDIIIGDGDSLSPENKTRFSDIIHHIADQETNDQTKAVHFLQEKGYRRIAIVGATGKREDHTLGNISLLLDYMKSGMEVRTVTDYGVFIPANGTQTFMSHTGQQISIINFGAKGLKGEGLVYPLSDFTNWWQGTLNEATSNRFTIQCTGEYLVFLASM